MTPINFNHFNLSNSIVSYEDISAFEFDTKNELSGKTIDFYNFDQQKAFDILSTLIEKRGGKVIIEEPVYKFGVFSDIHLSKSETDIDNYGHGNGRIDFTRGLSCLKNHNVDFACIAGDIGLKKDQHLSTEMLYDLAIHESGITFPISCCNGNHDTAITETIWHQITSCDLTYYDLRNDDKDLFFFMSLPIYPNAGQGYYDTKKPYSDQSINLLSSTLRDNPGKNVFLFMHLPLNSEYSEQFAGLGDQYYPGKSNYPNNYVGTSGTSPTGATYAGIYWEGFQLSSNDECKDDRNYRNEQNHFILETIRNYDGTVIVFNGHSHFVFEVENDIPTVLKTQIGKNTWSIHIPSLNYPRTRYRKQIVGNCPIKAPSQGYVVERCPHKLIIKGYEFNAIIDKELGDLRRTFNINLKN